MNVLVQVIISNLRNVTMLSTFPTHQLRVVNALSCLPEIYHEDRSYAFLFRSLSGDSRKNVLTAIERTLLFLTEGIPLTKEAIEEIQSLGDTFRSGIQALGMLYEKDMFVYERCNRIIKDWEHIRNNMLTIR